jgi:hypothetical protein
MNNKADARNDNPMKSQSRHQMQMHEHEIMKMIYHELVIILIISLHL